MLNHINIMGRLVAEPELKVTSSGVKVCSFRIASDRDYTSKDGEREVDFVDCVAWRASAEFLTRNFHKGMPILVSGRLQMRNWTDRDNNKRVSAEIQVENLYFAGGERRTSAPAAAPQFTDLDDDGDMPWNEDEELPL